MPETSGRGLSPCEKYPHDGCGCPLDDGTPLRTGRTPSVRHDWNLPTANPGIYWCRACGVVSNTLAANVPCLTTPARGNDA